MEARLPKHRRYAWQRDAHHCRQVAFAGDVAGNIVAYDVANGKPLWHAYLGSQVSNAPETYALDGHQYLLVAAGDTVYSFTLY